MCTTTLFGFFLISGMGLGWELGLFGVFGGGLRISLAVCMGNGLMAMAKNSDSRLEIIWASFFSSLSRLGKELNPPHKHSTTSL